MRFGLRRRCARTAVRVIAHRIVIGFPDRIKRYRSICCVASARLILRACCRLARRPAKELVACTRRFRAAQRQCNILCFGLRGRCTAAAVRVIAHSIRNGQSRNNFRACLLARGAGVRFDAFYARLRRGRYNAAIPLVRSRCIEVIAIKRLLFDLHGVGRRRGVGAAHPTAPIVPLIERIYRLLCTGAVTVSGRRVIIPLKPVFAVDRRNVFTRSVPVGRGTAPGVREVSLIPPARVGLCTTAASPRIAGAVTVHMCTAVRAVVIVIPVQCCGLHLCGIAGRYGIGRPVAPGTVIAPHFFRAGERPAEHGVGGAGRCQLISRPVALLRFDVLIGNPGRLGRRPVRPVALHVVFGILIITVCAADQPVRALRAAAFPASVNKLVPRCRDRFGFFRLARGTGVRFDAGFFTSRGGRHRSAVPAVALRVSVIVLVAGAANGTGI